MNAEPPNWKRHSPLAVLNGDESREIRTGTAKPGSEVSLSAAGSADPDNDSLSYRWWVYDKPSTWDGPVQIADDDQAIATLHVPPDAVGKTIHVILEVTDNGDPPLTSYRRFVLCSD